MPTVPVVIRTVPVLIHFLGLCVFSNQIPGDPGQKVILPTVVYSDHRTATLTTNTASARVAPTAHDRVTGDAKMAHPIWVPTPHVQDHAAVMMFPTASVDPSSDWGGAPIVLPNTSFSYVRLTGDHLRISASGAVVDEPVLQLPHLHDDLCNKMTVLNANFRPPAYLGAAAVLTLAGGVIKACLPAGQMRVDTEAALNSRGDLVILANTRGVQKVLRLKPLGGRVRLVIANIPISCLSGVCRSPQLSDSDSVSHVHAYYGMGMDTASCGRSIQSWFTHLDSSARPPACSMAALPIATGYDVMIAGKAGVGGGDDRKKMVMANFECSNSQWP